MREIPSGPTRQQLRYAIRKIGQAPAQFGRAPGATTPIPPRKVRRRVARDLIGKALRQQRAQAAQTA